MVIRFLLWIWKWNSLTLTCHFERSEKRKSSVAKSQKTSNLIKMMIQKFKTYLLVSSFLIFWNLSNAQTEFKKVNIELYYEYSNPIIGANIVIKNSNPTIGTTSDYNGKAKLNFNNWNDEVIISYLGPTDIHFKIIKNSDLITVNLRKGKITFYHQNKKINRIRIKRNK